MWGKNTFFGGVESEGKLQLMLDKLRIMERSKGADFSDQFRLLEGRVRSLGALRYFPFGV